MTEQKKQRERTLLEEFLAKKPDLAQITILESEHPDFLLECESGRIGIELAEYFQGKRGSGGSENRKSEAVCERLRSRITDEFRGEASRADLERRSGSLRFKSHGSNLGGEEAQFISELAALVKASPGGTKREHYEIKDYPTLSKWLQRLVVYESNGVWLSEPWGCFVCGAGAVGITEGELLAAVNTKKGLAESYKANGKCRSVFLLVCAAGGVRLSECSGDGENLDALIVKVQPEMANLGFDEIHFYSRDGGWARKLYPRS